MYTVTDCGELEELATAVLDTAEDNDFETVIIRTSAGFFRPRTRAVQGIFFGPTGYAFGPHERHLSVGYLVPSDVGPPRIATNVEFPTRHRELFLLEDIQVFLGYLAQVSSDPAVSASRLSMIKGSLRQLLPEDHPFK